MSNIINDGDVKVQKYQFKDLGIQTDKNSFNSDIFSDTESQIDDTPETITNNNDEVNGELFEKIDALTSQIVDLQIELQNQKKSYEMTIEEQKQTLFEDGKKEGIGEATKDINDQSDELKNQLINSITTLDEQKSQFDIKFNEIEADLIESAIAIARKVIKKELEQNSADIAKTIATSLIKTVKDTTKVTLKVNKSDFVQLSEHFNGDSINIMADDAVSLGGIILLNNDGNIDATITTRLNQALDLIGKE